MANFVIGIDLGTTNIAVSFLDLTKENAELQTFKILQLIEEGESMELETLPSFLYYPGTGEFSQGVFDLPWAKNRNYCVGSYARKKATAAPNRTISSAKSWLCVSHIDRNSPILPWNQENIEKKLSPLETSRRFLEHLKDCWNNNQRENGIENFFENQEIILTVPASFDAIARDLTVKAAELAGLKVTLLEEPQAAFYAWLRDHQNNWRDQVIPGDRVLVCDIGGGTSDFSLIEVESKDGDLHLNRIAVGNHILLGGDNFDLALAFFLANKLQTDQNIHLDTMQMASLNHACREAKEKLFENPLGSPYKITILGRGSSLIGGAITIMLSYEELKRIVIEGFFPSCTLDEAPIRKNAAGLREFGLRYESDPAITKHLASFLSRHSEQHGENDQCLPNLILFNGGVSKAKVLQEKIINLLNQWRNDEKSEIRGILGNNPELAVAMGACYYGQVRKGQGIRIKAGSPHSYYLGIESNMPAVPGFTPPTQGLCIVPFGMEEGTDCEIPYKGLGLLTGESTVFRFFLASHYQDDYVGKIINDINAYEVIELPELVTELPLEDSQSVSGALIPVRLKTVLSDIGILEVWCIEEGGERRWKLEYELRSLTLKE